MKHRLLILLSVVTFLTLGSGQTFAHHSFTSVYMHGKSQKIEGTVKEFIWRNPHSYVKVEAPDEKGEMQIWVIEWAAPTQLSEKGMTRTTLRPGDHVLIRDGHIYINGSELVEPYVNQPWSLTRSLLQTPTASDGQIVPPDSYFVLGDNRDHSNDSRTFGYISRDQIEEKAWLRFWPAGTAGFLGVRPYFASRLNAA